MLLTASIFLFKNNILSQNLIQNGSFEYYSNSSFCANGDISVVNSWTASASPDYFNSSCNSGMYNIPSNVFGESYAMSGSGYVGVIVYQKPTELKEYIQQNITNSLIADNSYYVSFFVARADRVTHAIKNIGAYFSITRPNSPYISANPQIFNQNVFLTDTVNWTKIEGYFKAQGGEQYISIGNFNSNTNTDTLYVGTQNPIPFDPNEAYYYIDSVSLYDSLDYVTNVLQIKNNISLSIFPNPAQNKINVTVNTKNQIGLSIKITDVLGRETKQLEYKEEIDISELEKGIYFLSLYQNRQLIGTKKVIKE